MGACPVCGVSVEDLDQLAVHLVGGAESSDIAHVMWLNRNVTKHRVDAARLAVLLQRFADGESAGEERVAR
jgi:hypothetical protein